MEVHLGLPARKRMRLKGYDYRMAGSYFITICTVGKRCDGGEVVAPAHPGAPGASPRPTEPKCLLSPMGRIVRDEALRIPLHFSSVNIDSFIVMPNHVHLLLSIMVDGDSSLSGIIGRFKSVSTRRVNEACGTSGRKLWQTGFYDHVIRDRSDFEGRCSYIERNPFRWIGHPG